METYHKIQTVYKRDPATNYKTLLVGDYSLPEFAYLAENKWVFTEKVNGTNIRVYFDGQQLAFKGKTDQAQIPVFLLLALDALFTPKLDLLKSLFPDGVCLYGEGYGAKIQGGGGNYRPDQGFVLFDICIGPWWLQRTDVESIAQQLQLDIVPIIGDGTLPEMVALTQTGFNSKWGNFTAEGIVARPAVELQARNGHRIITKIKYKDFIRSTT